MVLKKCESENTMQILLGFLRGVSRDFRPKFFSRIEPIWAPDKQAKIVFLKNSFSRRFRIFCKYLREKEFLSKTILAYLSGVQMGLIHEIKKYQKISWHCPFKLNFVFFNSKKWAHSRLFWSSGVFPKLSNILSEIF